MLTNTSLITFVNRVAADQDLRSSLEADFDGTLLAHGLELSTSEKESLQASFRYLRGVNPISLENRIAATKSGC